MTLADRPLFSRRRFIAAGAAGVGTIAVFNPLDALGAAATAGHPPATAGAGEGGYGPLASVEDPNGSGWALNLPAGFAFAVFGIEGSTMADGHPTPKAHDGMASFPLSNGNIRLVRNHEDRNDSRTATVKGDPDKAYDPTAGAGTTSLEVAQHEDGSIDLVKDFVSLGGTFVNCAGGPTPWGTWVTCEETTDGTGEFVADPEGGEFTGSGGWAKAHGYVFEVSGDAEEQVEAVALPALGRFAHEAIAVDPWSGYVHLTEDGDEASGFYRFVPASYGDLSEGTLQMLAVTGQDGYDTAAGQTVDQELLVEWRDLPDPDPAEADTNGAALVESGLALGCASFSRLEGCWHANGAITFASTDGGEAGSGQIWQYTPVGRTGGVLKLVFESPSVDVLDSPDNVNVTPRGGVLLCEDGGSDNLFLRGLTPDGRIFDLAENITNGREWAGACWSPNGRTLFVNVQGDTAGPDVVPPASGDLGVTIAIWGPWEDGAL
ncbi:MAG: DUF839 domain-containing protein [Acidimicrobiia bacterium]|nr:DUF839 domain-containing protein [Acidimicrobiia bacterium]